MPKKYTTKLSKPNVPDALEHANGKSLWWRGMKDYKEEEVVSKIQTVYDFRSQSLTKMVSHLTTLQLQSE